MRFLLFFAAIAPAFACQAIESDRIFGKDIAAASPLFAAMEPNLEIGSAPLAGVQRVFRPDELVRLAKQHAIELASPVTAICFERATEPLTAEQLLPILRTALAIDAAKIEILDFSHLGVPRGTFEFTHPGLASNGLWRGRLLYDQGRSLPIWVKTHITVERSWIEPIELLATGKPILASQIILKTGPRFPFDPIGLESLELVAGRRPMRTLQPGTLIQSTMLTVVHDIERGDVISVQVRSGGAILDFDATADSSGRAGEFIMVKNPENGRTFQARIQDKGHVLVQK